MAKILPKDLTSYDFLKAAAVVLMAVDHAGYFFFPEDNWWRAAGRICVPIWFFLVGYARERRLEGRLWAGAAILAAAYAVAGSHFLPFSILATILAIRFVLDRTMAFVLRNTEILVLSCAALVVLIIPTNYLAEYGTQGLILAMAGYLVRNGRECGKSEAFVQMFMVFAFLSFVVPQFFFFGFTPVQFYLMAGGVGLAFLYLYRFRPVLYPELTRRIPAGAARVIRFMGRRTLEIYVGHIILFQIIALLQGQERFGLFAWKLMPAF